MDNPYCKDIICGVNTPVCPVEAFDVYLKWLIYQGINATMFMNLRETMAESEKAPQVKSIDSFFK